MKPPCAYTLLQCGDSALHGMEWLLVAFSCSLTAIGGGMASCFSPGGRRGSLFSMGPLGQHASKSMSSFPFFSHLFLVLACIDLLEAPLNTGMPAEINYLIFFAFVDSHVKLICTYLDRKWCLQGLNLNDVKCHSFLTQKMLFGKSLTGRYSPVCQEILILFLMKSALGV